MPLDLSMTKLLVLAVIAMIVFGPEKLPQLARDAGRMLRQFRNFAQQARSDLKSELGDAVGDLDISDLNPRTFVRKHLFEDDPADGPAGGTASTQVSAGGVVAAGAAGALGAVSLAKAGTATLPDPRPDPLPPGQPAPFDSDAT